MIRVQVYRIIYLTSGSHSTQSNSLINSTRLDHCTVYQLSIDHSAPHTTIGAFCIYALYSSLMSCLPRHGNLRVSIYSYMSTYSSINSSIHPSIQPFIHTFIHLKFNRINSIQFSKSRAWLHPSIHSIRKSSIQSNSVQSKSSGPTQPSIIIATIFIDHHRSDPIRSRALSSLPHNSQVIQCSTYRLSTSIYYTVSIASVLFILSRPCSAHHCLSSRYYHNNFSTSIQYTVNVHICHFNLHKS